MKDKVLISMLIIIFAGVSVGASSSCRPIHPSPGLYCETTGYSTSNQTEDSLIHLYKQFCEANNGVLNMAHNFVRKLTSDSFKPYQFLKELYLEENSLESVSPDAFSGLKYLTKLNLRHNNKLKNLKNLPAPLELLDLSKCDLFSHNNSVDLSNLKSLKRLNLRDAELTKIPRLDDVGGSLETLDVEYNDIDGIRVADLASLCKLETLYFTKTEMNGDPCDCLAVQQWIRQHNIKGSNITCGEKGKTVMCARPVDLTEYDNMRRKCNLSSIWGTYWIYGAGIILIIFCIIFCIFACKRMKCNQISVLDDEES